MAAWAFLKNFSFFVSYLTGGELAPEGEILLMFALEVPIMVADCSLRLLYSLKLTFD